MKCDKCKAQEATVHEVSIKGGKRVEKHLCEQCAKQEGLPVQSFVGPQQVLQAIVAQQAQAAAGATATGSPETCPHCGMKFASFRQSGLLGCPECYAAFAGQLSAPLERWHEGGTHHVGKTPKRVRAGTPAPDRAAAVASAAAMAAIEHARRRVETLRRQLAEAVEGEQYERAAKLRDEIRKIETQGTAVAGGEPPPSAPPPAPPAGAPA